MEYGIVGTIVLALNIYAIYHILTSGASGLAKIVWTMLSLALPVVGVVIWLVTGPRGGSVRV